MTKGALAIGALVAICAVGLFAYREVLPDFQSASSEQPAPQPGSADVTSMPSLPVVSLTTAGAIQVEIPNGEMQAIVDRLVDRCDREFQLIAIAVAWAGAPRDRREEPMICAHLADEYAFRDFVSNWRDVVTALQHIDDEPFAPGFDLQDQLQNLPNTKVLAQQLDRHLLERSIRELFRAPVAGSAQVAATCNVSVEQVNLAVAFRDLSLDPVDRVATCRDLRSDVQQSLDRGLLDQIARREALRFIAAQNPSLTPRL